MRKRLEQKPTIRRHLDGSLHIRSDSDISVVEKLTTRKRLPIIKRKRLIAPTCYVCLRPIGGATVYIGNNTYRCFDCYPGSSTWLSSVVGNKDKYKEYKEVFLRGIEKGKASILRRKNKKVKAPDVKLAEAKKTTRKRLTVARIRINNHKNIEFLKKRRILRKKIIKMFNVPSSIVSVGHSSYVVGATTKRTRLGGRK